MDKEDIGYNLAMDSLKKEFKRKGLGKYYYQVLNIPTTLSYSPSKTQDEGDE